MIVTVVAIISTWVIPWVVIAIKMWMIVRSINRSVKEWIVIPHWGSPPVITQVNAHTVIIRIVVIPICIRVEGIIIAIAGCR
jgi:hypothetical protein